MASQSKKHEAQQSTKSEGSVGRDFIGATQRATKAIVGIVQTLALIGLLAWIVVDFEFVKDWLRGLKSPTNIKLSKTECGELRPLDFGK